MTINHQYNKLRFSLLIILSIYSSLGFSQNSVIESTRELAFYVGVDNPLRVILLDHDCESYFLTTSNGTIHRIDSCYYLYLPQRAGNSIINFNQIIGSDTVVIEQRNCVIRELPKPTAEVSDMKSGDISKDMLIVQKGVYLTSGNIGFDLSIGVKSFKTIILREDKLIFFGVNQGGRFTKETISGLSLIQPRDSVYFVSIIGVYPTGTEILTNSIELNIK